MVRQIFARSNLLALALLGALLVPEPAAAQQGWNRYQLWRGGWGPSSVGSYYGGYGYGGYGGYDYPAPGSYYSSPGSYYSSPGSYYSSPGYNTVPNYSTNGPMNGYRPFLPRRIGQGYGNFGMSDAGDAMAADRAVINVSVPENASITFEGQQTTQRGAMRQFISPPLVSGQAYSYKIEAKWSEDGKEVTRSRQITVHAGAVVNLSFNSNTAPADSAP